MKIAEHHQVGAAGQFDGKLLGMIGGVADKINPGQATNYFNFYEMQGIRLGFKPFRS